MRAGRAGQVPPQGTVTNPWHSRQSLKSPGKEPRHTAIRAVNSSRPPEGFAGILCFWAVFPDRIYENTFSTRLSSHVVMKGLVQALCWARQDSSRLQWILAERGALLVLTWICVPLETGSGRD